MSAVNIHPPQTYSRLFRPWDSSRSAAASNADRPSRAAIAVKAESCSTPESPATIKTERNVYAGTDGSDRECASSTSSSKSSYDDAFSMNSPLHHKRHDFDGDSPSVAAAAAAFNATPRLYASFQQQQQQLQMPAGDLYYAAAAAAAAAAANGIGVSPSAAVSAANAAAAAYGVDPYALMEQEYARVMAEDAHLKAINARKQRPKKFKCPHCNVAFSNNGQLKGHIRIHTGERPFKCDVETCGKTFTRNEELTRHKRIHTGLRPYPCSVCGKKFGRRDHLKKHMKTHMPQERQLGPAIFVPMYPYLYGY